MASHDDVFQEDGLDTQLDALAGTAAQGLNTPTGRAYHHLNQFYAHEATQEAQAIERVRQRLLARSAALSVGSLPPSQATSKSSAPLSTHTQHAQAVRQEQRQKAPTGLRRSIGAVATVLVVCALVGSFFTLLNSGFWTPESNAYHWKIIPSPNTSLAVNTLTGITVRSSNDAWAWGVANVAPGTYGSAYGSSNPIQTPLVEHWDGQHWRIVATPQPPEGGQLTDIVAVTANDAWAVGQQLTGGSENTSSEPLVERWDGRQWMLVQDNVSDWPNASGLSQLAALSANNIWAVGQSGGNTQVGLIQHWDGRSWQTIANPSPQNVTFSAITALTPNDIWVVGMEGSKNAVFEHWDGAQWRLVPGPSSFSIGPFHGHVTLNSISAVSANDVWASGFTSPAISLSVEPLFEHWDGHKWSIVSGPSVNATTSDIVALGPDDVWAVGTRTSGFLSVDVAQQGQGLVEHWDGHTWSLIANPTPQPFTSLSGVARDPAVPGKVWVVGITGPAFSSHDQLTDTSTLIETTQTT